MGHGLAPHKVRAVWTSRNDRCWILRLRFATRWMTLDGGLLNSRSHVRSFLGMVRRATRPMSA